MTFSDLFLLMVSPFVGSFLALLADRLPRGESVVIARSKCRGCGRSLMPLDLVPILSFAATRGHCRGCGSVIPPWLLYTEIGAIGLAVMAVLAADTPVEAWGFAVFLWLLWTLALCDLTRFRLPDPLTAALFVVALGLAVLPSGIGISSALIGACVGVGSFGLIRIGYRALRSREGMGLGDVKLMAGLGAFAGPFDLPVLVLIAAMGGLAAALMALLVGRGSRTTPLGQRALPFGVALTAAAAALWLTRMTPVFSL